MSARNWLVLLLLFPFLLRAQPPVYPLSAVQQGLRGTGYTVFSGQRVEPFQVEILGVLENTGPQQSIVLARLSGGPLEQTGVLQGMSGSPVFIGDKLLGAIAYAFAFSKEPIAGIRPIEEMLRVDAELARLPARRISLADQSLAAIFPERREIWTNGSRLVEIATPVCFSGFTEGTIRQFASQLRALGLEPTQAILGGSTSGKSSPPSDPIRPGSMITVELVRGDMSIGANGTVTYVDGQRVYAFGHRFLSVGRTSLPFSRAEVLALAPNLATSFKISATREPLGAITADYSTGVLGELGQAADLIPVQIQVRERSASRARGREFSYRLEVVQDRFLSPLLLQMALYSAIDATERTIGTSTVAVRTTVEFHNGIQPMQLEDMYAGDSNVPLQASVGVAIPLAFLMQSGFEQLKLKAVNLDVAVYEERRSWGIDQVWPSRKKVRPGEAVDLTIVMVGDNGAERIERVHYRVPIGAAPGPLYFTVSDANSANLAELQQWLNHQPRTPGELISFLNRLRKNTQAYVRVWRPFRGYTVRGHSLPAPPPSVSLVLGGGQSILGGASVTLQSKITELAIDGGEAVVTGSKTVAIQIEDS